MDRQKTIEYMQQLAQKKGGKCLSPAYINTTTKLLWECSQGHQWQAPPSGITRGSWCHACAFDKTGWFDEVKLKAKARGGKCLSAEYVNTLTKLRWECNQGHQWEATPASIKMGTWCPFCAAGGRDPARTSAGGRPARPGKIVIETSGETIKIKKTIEDMQRLAQERGGKCLSSACLNNQTKLLWECNQGHQWEARAGSVHRGEWCPTCAKRRE